MVVAKGSNRVRGQKNAFHPSPVEAGDSSNYGGVSHGLSDSDEKSQHIFRDSLIQMDEKKGVKPKKVSKKGGASFKSGTTSKTLASK